MAGTIFQEYLNLLFDNFGGMVSPMDWLEMDMTMSKTEIFILLLLEREKDMKVSDIGKRLGMPLSTTTSIVDRLERKKLVERVRSTEDRRVVIVGLTSPGEKMCAEIAEKMEKMLRDIWRKISSGLTQEEINCLKSIYYKITNN